MGGLGTQHSQTKLPLAYRYSACLESFGSNNTTSRRFYELTYFSNTLLGLPSPSITSRLLQLPHTALQPIASAQPPPAAQVRGATLGFFLSLVTSTHRSSFIAKAYCLIRACTIYWFCQICAPGVRAPCLTDARQTSTSGLLGSRQPDRIRTSRHTTV